MDGVVVDHDFGHFRPTIVVRRHGKAVSTCAHDGEQIALRERQLSVFAEKISRFTDRAHDVPR